MQATIPESKSETTRRRIVESAAHVLRNRGLSGTKLADIAAEAGIFAGSMYYHFKSKEHLVEVVMIEGMNRNTRYIRSKVKQLGARANPLAKLRAAIFAHVEYMLQGDDCSSAVARVFQDLPEDMRRRVTTKAYTTFDNMWRDMIKACASAGVTSPGLDATVVRLLLLGMLQTTPSWYRAGRMSPQEISDQVWKLFSAGFVTTDTAATL
jgi:AcrR family transcriptional regulator